MNVGWGKVGGFAKHWTLWGTMNIHHNFTEILPLDLQVASKCEKGYQSFQVLYSWYVINKLIFSSN